MKRKLISHIVVGLTFLVNSQAFAEMTGIRWCGYTGSILPTNYVVYVSILVCGTSETGAIVTEIPPGGWTIDASASNGVVTDGVISWTGITSKKLLTYRLDPPKGASGKYFFEGKVGDRPIEGQNFITTDRKTSSGQLAFQTGLYYNYLVYLPPGYSPSYPHSLLLHLHTESERGSDLEMVRSFGIAKLVNDPSTVPSIFPFILVSPQCPSGDDNWKESELLALLDEIYAHYSIYKRKVYMTGCGFGGDATWNLAGNNPDLFIAIAPISGGNPSQTQLQNMAGKVAVWSFHNTNDNVTSPTRQIDAINSLKELGGDAQITLYEDSSNDAWTKTFSNPEFYDWLLQHINERGLVDVNDWMLHNE